MISTAFSEEQYNKLYVFISKQYGMQYGHEKKDILLGRCEKVMRRNGIQDPDYFVRAILSGSFPDLRQDFINTITVNKTQFFRESQHFDYILQRSSFILESNPSLMEKGELRAWSAASSTGEEPYTLAMVLKEAFGDTLAIKVLATDIDTRVLSVAQQGIYSPASMADVPRLFALKYFAKAGENFMVRPEIKDLLSFRSFNLMNEFPFRHKFDMVFCRNVMIYFKHETQAHIIRKIHQVMNPGGLLFTGHSEALPEKNIGLVYRSPAIYAKNQMQSGV